MFDNKSDNCTLYYAVVRYATMRSNGVGRVRTEIKVHKSSLSALLIYNFIIIIYKIIAYTPLDCYVTVRDVCHTRYLEYGYFNATQIVARSLGRGECIHSMYYSKCLCANVYIYIYRIWSNSCCTGQDYVLYKRILYVAAIEAVSAARGVRNIYCSLPTAAAARLNTNMYTYSQ